MPRSSPAGRPQRLDRDLAERLGLVPGRLALLVELEQREQRHRDRHAVGVADRLVEAAARRGAAARAGARGARRPTPAGIVQVAQVERGRQRSRPPSARAERGRARRRPRRRRGHAAQVRRQRRRAVAHAVLAGEPRPRGGRPRGGSGAPRASARAAPRRPRRARGRAARRRRRREQQPRLQLEQRGDQHEELGRRLEVELAARLEVVEVGEHDVGELDLEQVDLLAQDERQQQVERAREDLEVELERRDGHGARALASGSAGARGSPVSVGRRRAA